MSRAVRVAVADDHPMFRFGLVAALASTPEVEVVGEASDGAALLHLLAEVPVDVVLSDLEMPGPDGLAITAELARTRPDLPVILLTMHGEHAAVRAAIDAGARGYLLKGADRDDIVRAVLTVAAGGSVYGTGVRDVVRELARRESKAAEPPFPDLTPRERDVLSLLATGAGNHAIAGALGLSEKTVRNHVSNILVKLAVATRAAAVARARDEGLGSRTHGA